MSIKNKKQSNSEKLTNVAAQAGLLLMAAAATVGMFEVPEHDRRVLAVAQTSFAPASQNEQGNDNNTMRRERDEVGPHYVSYSAFQRTPGRTGKF